MQTLIALCHKKNELNRKRRRFWHLQNIPFGPHGNQKFKSNEHYPTSWAYEQYTLCKQQMKAMTAEMRQLRKECGARFVWSVGGMITHVTWANGKSVHHKNFKKFYEAEVFENELFKEKKV